MVLNHLTIGPGSSPSNPELIGRKRSCHARVICPSVTYSAPTFLWSSTSESQSLSKLSFSVTSLILLLSQSWVAWIVFSFLAWTPVNDT